MAKTFGEQLLDESGKCPACGRPGCDGHCDPDDLADLDPPDEPVGDDLCDLCMTSGVNADRTTPCGKTIGIECGCDESCQDGLCGDESCEDCYPPDGGDPFGDDEDEEEADDLAMAALLLAQARPGQPLPETLDALEAAVGDTSHEPLCPSRAGGECLCIRSKMIELLLLYDREV